MEAYRLLSIFAIIIFLSINPLYSQNVDSVDTPYTKDEHTRLLLHFDGDIETDLNARLEGDAGYLEYSWIDAMQQGLTLNNSSSNDTAYVEVQDTSAIDLQNSWTIEMWVFFYGPLNTICADTSIHQVLWSKAGSDTTDINYQTYVDMCSEQIITDYTVSGKGNLQRFKSDTDIINLGEWYHIAVTRDNNMNQFRLFVHRYLNSDNETRLIYKRAWNFETHKMVNNDYSLTIGRGSLPTHPETRFYGVWGGIDEFRISDTVRTYARSTDIEEPGGNIPDKFRLKPNYPNPFNPSTNIRFSLPQSEQVTINIYNTIGQKIETLLNRQMTAGSHSVTFDAKSLPSGVYIYRLKAGEYRESRKMLLVK